MARSPPLPARAGYNLAANTWFCTFDQPLRPGTANAANWGGRIDTGGGVIVTWGAIGVPTIANYTVRGVAARGLPGVGAPVVDYKPPPFDVHSVYTVPAAAFADFPLTMYP